MPDPTFAAPGGPASGERRYPIVFDATAGEYFRLWIVNIALTLVTLGIYSAWAKVRKRRYFYAHTRIDGDGFDYRGNPVGILKGRLIAVGVLAATYAMMRFVSPLAALLLFVAVVFGLPWVFVQSLRFNAAYSAFRNVRFRFTGSYGSCLGIFVPWGLFAIITFGLGYPSLKARLVEFAVRHLQYGTTEFDTDDLKSPFYRILRGTIGIGFLWGIAAAIVGGIATVFAPRQLANVVRIVLSYALYLVIYAYSRVRTSHAVFGAARLGAIRFENTMAVREMSVLYMVNILAIIATLGLATPWAVVRTMRYRAEHMALLVEGGLDTFVASEAAQVSAAGAEVGDLLDIDIGL